MLTVAALPASLAGLPAAPESTEHAGTGPGILPDSRALATVRVREGDSDSPAGSLACQCHGFGLAGLPGGQPECGPGLTLPG